MIIAEQNVSILKGNVDRMVGMHAGRLRGRCRSHSTWLIMDLNLIIYALNLAVHSLNWNFSAFGQAWE